ncbi:MAG: ABC transporter permease [Ancalomicrobiaceae bacterium]|nr:ABC transporter permease [Ancalomicrobiaceae bacterium]
MPDTSHAANRASSARRRADFKALGPFIALAALIVLGAVVNPVFLTPGNLINVLTRTAFTGVIAIGGTFIITTGGIDLSVGALAAFVSGVMIIVMNALTPEGLPPLMVVLLGTLTVMVIGALAGLVNGLLITRGRIEPFIVTLGTMGIFRSLVTYLADGGTLSLNSQIRSFYRPVYYSGVLGITYPIIVFALVSVIGAIVLYRTRYGRYVTATGANEEVARYSAIHVDRIKLAAYALQGLCVGLAVFLYVPRLGSASATTGLGWELEAIAAVIIGGTLMKGGSGRIWGTVSGAIILASIDNILNLTGAISVYLNSAIQGCIIIVAVLVQRDAKSRP